MNQAESLLKIMKNRQTKHCMIKKPRIISIASGKGGVGKTNVSVSLGLSLGSLGKEVVLMDADLGLANVNVIFGIMPKYTLSHLLDGNKDIEDILIPAGRGMSIVAGACGMNRVNNLSEVERNIFMKNINKLDKMDIILIDTGAGIADNVLQFVLSSAESIIVTTPEPTSIADAYGIIKTIIAKKSKADIKLIVNRVRDQNEGEQVAKRIIDISRRFLNFHIGYLGFIVEDSVVSKSVIQQKPFYLLYQKSKAAKCIDKISHNLCQLQQEDFMESKGLSYFFHRFLKF